jgi:hypothetical protein
MEMRRLSLILALLTTFPLVVSASPQDGSAVLAESCVAALNVCSVTCNDLGDRAKTQSCLTRCDRAAATCFGDEEATLSSEEYLAHWGDALVFAQSEACHDTTPCPPEFGSCGSWSDLYDCGDPQCSFSTLCQQCNEWDQCTIAGPMTSQVQERFRVCFNQQMQGCTEYQNFLQSLGCGC